MDRSLIKKYNITFFNKVMNFPGHKPYLRKVIDCNNIHLTNFFLDWDKVQDIDEYLVPGIDNVLQGVEPEFETGSVTFNVVVSPEVTIFYTELEGSSYPSVPTQDFYEILLGWRDFLLTPPYNGAIV